MKFVILFFISLQAIAGCPYKFKQSDLQAALDGKMKFEDLGYKYSGKDVVCFDGQGEAEAGSIVTAKDGSMSLVVDPAKQAIRDVALKDASDAKKSDLNLLKAKLKDNSISDDEIKKLLRYYFIN